MIKLEVGAALEFDLPQRIHWLWGGGAHVHARLGIARREWAISIIATVPAMQARSGSSSWSCRSSKVALSPAVSQMRAKVHATSSTTALPKASSKAAAAAAASVVLAGTVA